MKIIIVINAGSSSIKFQVFNNETLESLASGILERLYIDGSYKMDINNQEFSGNADFSNHEIATNFLIEILEEHNVINEIKDILAVGHRIVQGGEYFKDAAIINEKELKIIEDLVILAPLHNPGGISGINAFKKIAPNVINIADFDTSFHTSIPIENNTYAIPKKWRNDYQVKRYGAHGISYEYITRTMAKELNKDINNTNLIIAHLGNGASIAAIKNGKSYNTSMGLTPLAGLIMGTRSGDIDPSIANYVSFRSKKDIGEITTILNKESGLKGLCGFSDMRDIGNEIKLNNKDAILAMKLWAKQTANYIVTYYNQLKGDVDAIIFTAGIGENAVLAREAIFNEVHIINSKISTENNIKKYDKILCISNENSEIPIYVLRTNEELLIAKKIKEILK